MNTSVCPKGYASGGAGLVMIDSNKAARDSLTRMQHQLELLGKETYIPSSTAT
jgi:hypothetical protein